MNEREEAELEEQLMSDEAKRDRGLFDYTIDVLLEGAIIPWSIWPESNQNAKMVISGEVDYNTLPMDEVNEFHKGGLFSEQQDIILRNWPKEALCEALNLNSCLKEECPLYLSELAPPVCREFKMVFPKKR